jgi:hypothetical protein
VKKGNFMPEPNTNPYIKNEDTPSSKTHKNKTIYICRFQRLLSCIQHVPTHSLLLRTTKTNGRGGKEMGEEEKTCERSVNGNKQT